MPTLELTQTQTPVQTEQSFKWTWISVAQRFLPRDGNLFAFVPVRIHSWVDPQKGRLRIFQSDFLESLTVVHPIQPLAIFLPLSGYYLWQGAGLGLSGPVLGAMFAGGLFFWTFFEYAMHRLFFHFVPRNQWQIVLAYFLHGIHHAFPEDDRRLVMPPVLGLALFALVFPFFYFTLGRFYGPVVSGFLIGYLCYDMTHYSVHALPMKSRFGNMLRKHHMLHHYGTPDKRFGVSTPLWDYVFGTAQ